MSQDLTFIAQTNFRGAQQKFGIKRTDRRQHMYVIGKTGTGKTQFLKNMALQDIENGEGLAVIDPHGEFVEEVLESVPRHRMKDVVYFNPADMDFPVSFNIMDVKDPRYKHLIASGLIGIFTKIWANVWSARMEYILANCILALLDTPGTTLLGIPRMLVDRDYRQKIINNLTDPVVKSFWINEYEEWESRYRNEAIAPVQNKVGQFLNVSFVRNIVGQGKNTVDIEEIMNTGKILLVNVSKGRIGEDNSAILGAMLITKIQLSAMERVRIPENERRDFYLYVDEFQNFATDSFKNILSEARKYRLNLVMAHQYVGQLVTDTSTAVRDAVFGNVGTMVSFRVGAEDAEFLEREFTPDFLQDDIIRLANRDVYLKLMIDGITSRPFSARTITIPPLAKDETKRDEMIKLSRSKYSRSRQTVEDEINRWAANAEGATPSVDQKGKKVDPLKRPSQPIGRVQQDGTTLYDAVCSNCGKATKVIFPPTEGRQVFCKSCLKKAKTGKGPAKNDHFDDSPEKSNKQEVVEDTHDDNEDLAFLGIEFGSTKKPKIESVAFNPSKREKNNSKQPEQNKNQSVKRKEINLADLRKALEESLKSKEEEKSEEKPAEKPEEKKEDLPEIKPQEIQVPEPPKEEPKEELKMEEILEEANPIAKEEENNNLNLSPKSEDLDLSATDSEIKKMTQELLAPIEPESEPIPAPVLEPAPAPVEQNMPVQEPVQQPEPESVTPILEMPVQEPVAPETPAYDPAEELKKRIAQERMSDDAKKMLDLGIDIGPQKGEIKPGQTVKFKEK